MRIRNIYIFAQRRFRIPLQLNIQNFSDMNKLENTITIMIVSCGKINLSIDGEKIFEKKTARNTTIVNVYISLNRPKTFQYFLLLWIHVAVANKNNRIQSAKKNSIHVKYKILVVDIRRKICPLALAQLTVYSVLIVQCLLLSLTHLFLLLRNITYWLVGFFFVVIIVALRLCFFPLNDRSSKAYMRIVVVDFFFHFLSSADLLENQMKYAQRS